jgi:TorA maturation chaperone TorD
MADTQITLRDLLVQRNATYSFLSRLYKVEVDEEFYGFLRGLRVPAHTGSADVDAGYRQIIGYLSHAPANVLTELAVDYVSTFIGHGNNGYSAAYPFESVYTSPKRLLMQGARDEVLILYRAAGIEKSESWKDGEDHIALELEFMQILGARTVEALDAGDDEKALGLLASQRNFLEDHLLSWYPMMAADMKKFAKTGLYQGLADLTLGFLHTDRDLLREVLDESDETGAPAAALSAEDAAELAEDEGL